MIAPTQAFPCAMILMSLGAAVVYGFAGEWRQVAYWLFAAGITASVTF